MAPFGLLVGTKPSGELRSCLGTVPLIIFGNRHSSSPQPTCVDTDPTDAVDNTLSLSEK